jgi:hypothetical protein
MKISIFLLVTCLMLASASRAADEEETDLPADKVSKFMQVKLAHSQKVLEGLALEDFDEIAKHSQEMSLLSQSSTWNVLQTPEYLRQSGEFRRTADALTQAAKKKNLDGAALAYVELTLKCVQCHKYVRDVRKETSAKHPSKR